MSIPDFHRQVLLVERPTGIPQSHHFRVVTSPTVWPRVGEVMIRNEWLSVEPAMRGWVSTAANYSQPVAIGEVMRSFAVGRVVASGDDAWPVGTPVCGLFGWQEYACVPVSSIERRVAEDDLALSAALGILGINGITAHYGLLEIGQPRAGETVVVSSGAGAVGSAVGQIAKLHGCRTIAIAGGPRKVQLCLDTFRFDAAVDYKAPDFSQQLASAVGVGADIYFDNTSGMVSDAVMRHLRIGARVVVCGTAAVSDWDPPPVAPRVERQLLVHRARMQGFVIFDHQDSYSRRRDELAAWVRQKKIAYVEDVLEGIDSAPAAIAGLYRGDNVGKRLIRL